MGKITLENGVVLEADPFFNRLIKSKKLNGLQVYLATFPNGAMSYVLVDNGQAIFDTQSLDDMGAHLEIMALGKHFK